MAKIVVVTGGMRSGKSTFAESLIEDYAVEEEVVYVGTSVPCDSEMERRIEIHQERRPKSWRTLEKYKGFKKDDFPLEGLILLECVGTMVTNFFMDEVEDYEGMLPAEGECVEQLVQEGMEEFLEATRDCKLVVIVTNEIGMGMVPLGAGNRYYTDTLGRINQQLASRADKVYLCVAGIPIEVK